MWTTYKGEGATLGLTPALPGGGHSMELGSLTDERSHSQRLGRETAVVR